MNDTPEDPYRPLGQPEPVWGAAAEGAEPSPPAYPPYQPYAPPPDPQGYPQHHPQGYPQPFGAHPGYPPSPYACGPGAPAGHGMHLYGSQYSDKSKTTAGLLQLLLPFVGVCGVGRLYAGHTAIGVLQLLLYWVSFPLVLAFVGIPMLVGIWVWTVIDGIVMLSGSPRDGQGRLMR